MALELKNFDDQPEDEESGTGEKRPFDKKRILTMILGVFIIAIIVAPIWVGWHYSNVAQAQETEISLIQSEILLIETKIAKEKKLGEVDTAGKQKKIEELTHAPLRIEWSRIIAALERVTHEATEASGVDAIFSYTSYTVSQDGNINVSGFTNSYSAIADLIEALEASPEFADVKFSSSSKSQENIVSLSLQFSVVDEKPEVQTTTTTKTTETTTTKSPL